MNSKTNSRPKAEGTEVIELKTYTLVSADAVAKYTNEFWPGHIRSLHEYGITIHGLWTDAHADSHRVIALVEYPASRDPAEAAKRYRGSQDFVDDHADFDVRLITDEQTVRLQAVAASPLPENLHLPSIVRVE